MGSSPWGPRSVFGPLQGRGAMGGGGLTRRSWPAIELLLVFTLCCGPLAVAEEETTKKPPTETELSEYKQDFLDFDLDKDNQIDAQEVRSQFKGDLDPRELHQFFIDVDKDSSGTVTLKEYVDYAVTLS